MEDASQVRRAAREAVGETEPERLRARIMRALDAGSMVPGVLTLSSARAAASGRENDEVTDGRTRGARVADGSAPPPSDDTLARRAAGVQLIYEGLRLTRTLALEEPWTDPTRDRTEADIAILAADVLVARGFFLLARTAVAGDAVETVRRFGCDQTGRHDPDAGDKDLDRNLEADALELAVRCGVTAVGAPIPDDVADFAADLARSVDDTGFRAPDAFLSSSVTDSLAALVDGRATGVNEGVPPATDR